MPYVTYTAKRSLVSGHTADVSYSLEFSASVIDRSNRVERHTIQSMGGNTESLRVRKDVIYQVEPNYITEANLDDWREFLDSTDNCEAFVFDPTGTVAVPGTTIAVEVAPEFTEYSEQRLPSLVHYRIRFVVRAI